jgi:Skp family chaperone for outer membrane proteins
MMMKKLIQKISMAGMLLLAVSMSSQAQEGPKRKGPQGGGPGRPDAPGREMVANMTEEQKAMVKANMEQQKADREALRATFTEEQKAIMADQSKDMLEKRKALEASYTAAQKELVAKQREKAKAMREKLEATYTAEQKAEMQERRAKMGEMMRERRKAE